MTQTKAPPSGDGAPDTLVTSESAIKRAVKDELAEYFASPRASGLRLAEFEAAYIAAGIVARLSEPSEAS